MEAQQATRHAAVRNPGGVSVPAGNRGRSQEAGRQRQNPEAGRQTQAGAQAACGGSRSSASRVAGRGRQKPRHPIHIIRGRANQQNPGKHKASRNQPRNAEAVASTMRGTRQQLERAAAPAEACRRGALRRSRQRGGGARQAVQR